MSRRCAVTGKSHVKGRRYQTRGIAKKQGGIGINITGWSKRRFKINLMKKRFYLEDEKRWVTLRVTKHGMRIIDKIGVKKAMARGDLQKAS